MLGDDLKGQPGSSHHAPINLRLPNPPAPTSPQPDRPTSIQHIWVVLTRPKCRRLTSRKAINLKISLSITLPKSGEK